MGIKCGIFGCDDVAVGCLTDTTDYVLFRCNRCKQEVIFCAKEGKVLDNDEEGKRIVQLMMDDPDFSYQCTMHSEFVKADVGKFSYSKVQKEFKMLREKYGLPEGYTPSDPVELYKNGLWVPSNSGKKRKKSGPVKIKGEEDQNGYINVNIRISRQDFDRMNPGGSNQEEDQEGDVQKQEMTVEEKINRMERRMNKHVAKEEYEKAAKIRDKIMKLKGRVEGEDEAGS